MDPYGFPEASRTGADADLAVMALWTGVASLVCTAIGPCTCYATYLLSLPVGAYAMWAGWSVRTRAEPGPAGAATRNYGLVGLIGGGFSLGVLLLLVLVFAAYFVFVFGLAMIGVAAE